MAIGEFAGFGVVYPVETSEQEVGRRPITSEHNHRTSTVTALKPSILAGSAPWLTCRQKTVPPGQDLLHGMARKERLIQRKLACYRLCGIKQRPRAD